MSFRKTIFWLHLIAGSFAGIVVFTMSITGVALTYERQINAWADRKPRTVIQPPGLERLPVETMLARLREQRKEVPATLMVRADRRAAAEAVVDGNTVYLDPYTGRETGEASTGTRTFFRKMTNWHRWLGQEGEGREAARAITGASNLAVLFLVSSGFYLWWPRKWTKQSIRTVTLFRGGLPGKAREFNWHNVAGFWCAIPLFFVVLTAVFFSYSWATNLLYQVTGTQTPAFEGKKGRRPERRAARIGENGKASLAGLNPLWLEAERQVPGWRSITLRVPRTEGEPVSFTIDLAERGRPDLRCTVEMNRRTKEVIRAEKFSDLPSGRQLRTWARWVHTGEAGGPVGQTIAGIASAGGVLLVYTGLSLAIRRFFAWRKRQGAGAAEESRAA